jgi:long-chain acyl-CoA synthetase
MKIKRREVLNRLQTFETSPSDTRPATEFTEILAQVSSREAATLRDDLRLSEDLGLSSLEQLDLLSRLEEAYGVALDEEALSETETVGALRAWLEEKQTPGLAGLPGLPVKAKASAAPKTLALESVPRWERSRPIRWARTAISEPLFWPLLRHYIELSVDGLENLHGLRRPVLFAANHNSHLDTPVIMASLPFAWRTRVAPAMMQERFRAYFDPRGHSLKTRWRNMIEYYLATCLFNAYPLPHEMTGVRRALRFTGELVDHGFCPLVYPEGERSPDGTLKPFKNGTGLMAVRLRVPVVPIHHQGMFEIYSLHDSWPRTGAVHIRMGAALRFREGEDYQSATEAIRDAIEDLGKG